jgi:hypothetical protein
MLTDAEIDNLARELLTSAVNQVLEWDPHFFHEIHEMENSELIPVYGATLNESYGSFLCEYMPLATIKKLVVECEQVFDEFAALMANKPTLSDQAKKTISEHLSRGRDVAIKGMAKSTALHLIAFFESRLFDTVVEAVEDCKLIAGAQIAVTLAVQLNEITPGAVAVDARAEIKEAAERVANKKRKFLQEHIDKLPHLITERGPGAPPKSQIKREREREDYSAKVEAAYRRLRLEIGKTPTKTSIAKELGEGGTNPRTGSDSSLTAFGNKLRRLKVDYDAIAEKVEVELNNNS